jgi:hypothetical protein
MSFINDRMNIMLNVSGKKATLINLFLFIIALAFTWLHSEKSFFWDSVNQVSVPANWYFDNNFRHFFLPDEIASGHPPFMGMYIALIWKIFERSLFISHMAMFPFVFGVFFQSYKLITKTGISLRDSLLIMLVVLCDATLVSQMSIVTFDVPQIFFFLWCLNAIFDDRRSSLGFAFAALMLISLRGSLCGFGVVLFSIIYNYRKTGHFYPEKLIAFIPGFLLFIFFILAFYIQKHWIIFNPSSPNLDEFSGFASAGEVLRNIGLAGWRLIDFGRVGIWMVLVMILFNALKKRTLYDSYFSDILIIAICQFAIMFSVVVVFKNPFGHRYFLPVIIPVSVAVTYWILRYSRFKYAVYSIVLLTLFSGYYWIYPLKIAQGWDATPAHWPYFKIRNEMMQKIKASNISPDEIGTFWPNTASTKMIDLSDIGIILEDADLDSDKYILYSNVYNVSDLYIDELYDKSKWDSCLEVHRNRIFIILFKRKIK